MRASEVCRSPAITNVYLMIEQKAQSGPSPCPRSFGESSGGVPFAKHSKSTSYDRTNYPIRPVTVPSPFWGGLGWGRFVLDHTPLTFPSSQHNFSRLHQPKPILLHLHLLLLSLLFHRGGAFLSVFQCYDIFTWGDDPEVGEFACPFCQQLFGAQ